MTTVDAPNVHNIAIDGTFDDCQDLVKAMFNDAAFRDRMRLGAVNSINWARIMAQIVYYVHRRLAQLGAPERRVVVRGADRQLRQRLRRLRRGAHGRAGRALVVGSNRNDILTRFFASGEMTSAVVPPLSPSMDIQVSSNLERLLFDLLRTRRCAVRRLMTAFRETGVFAVDAARLKRAPARVPRPPGSTTTPPGRRSPRPRSHRHLLVDPHTAVGLSAAAGSVVAISAMRRWWHWPPRTRQVPRRGGAATGIRPALPPRLADLLDRPERTTALPNDLSAIEDFIADRVAARGVAA
jgi:threonine synthase